jgi:4-diphosphocytidyl-2-C-methyl-D-erythritol kinase
MVAVDLFDRLEFRPDDSGALTLTCDEPGLTCGPDNLVLKAANRLKREMNHPGGARIHLEKRIPMQAGMAGGSSDAATTLKGLNELWGLGLQDAELARLGAEVGSDVAFFFSPGAAWCTGRGEMVEPLTLGRTLDFVIACPGVGLSTAEVFRRVRVPAKPASGSEIRQVVEHGDVEEIGRRLHNRLQEPAEALCPQVREARRKLESMGPAGCLMTGSGSAVFAVCRDRNDAIRVARTMGAEVEGTSSHDGTASHALAGPAGEFKLHVVRSWL